MSIESSIDLRIVQTTSGSILSPIRTLEILIKNGWKLQRNGGVYYLNSNDSDWASAAMSIESLMKILNEREQNDEHIGVTITWQDTNIGGEVILWSNKDMLQNKIHTSLSFLLTMNRQILADYGHFKITDVNWYLTKLLPAFNHDDSNVEYYTYEEHA